MALSESPTISNSSNARFFACAAGMPSKDTIKIADENGCVSYTPPRQRVWNIQTPQVFSYKLICDAYKEIREKSMTGITDDAMVVETMTDHKVKLVDASNLVYQKTIWFGENFARVDTTRTMDLDLVIDGPTSKKVKLQFKAPKLEDFWKIGICMKEGFCASVKIGNEKTFVETDTFSVI